MEGSFLRSPLHSVLGFSHCPSEHAPAYGQTQLLLALAMFQGEGLQKGGGLRLALGYWDVVQKIILGHIKVVTKKVLLVKQNKAKIET